MTTGNQLKTISGSFPANWFWILLLALISSGGAIATGDISSQTIVNQTPAQPIDIGVFVREGCPHCDKAKEFLGRLQHEQPGLRIVIRDVSRETKR